MKMIYFLERKLGRFAVRNLMKYILVLFVLGLMIGSYNSSIYYEYLSLDFSMIFKGQIWRLVTFLIPLSNMNNILFTAISMFFYYSIGNALENVWGSFRFNLYLFSGIIFYVIGALIIYLMNGPEMTFFVAILATQALEMILGTLFFAFAAIYAESKFLIYFFIPVKAKYLAWLRGGIYVYEIITNIMNKNYWYVFLLILVMANFIIFFFATKNYRNISPSQMHRKAKFKRQVNQGIREANTSAFSGRSTITRHKCAVCGKTEVDDEDLEFRFCSRCDGNYEYCMEHLFTHEHVKSAE